jgi:hypothetical protein
VPHGKIFAHKARRSIWIPSPPRESEQAIERAFVEKATRTGIVNAHVLKKNGHWAYVAEFIDTEKAALFASGLAKATGSVLKVDTKPTSSDAENRIWVRRGGAWWD